MSSSTTDAGARLVLQPLGRPGARPAPEGQDARPVSSTGQGRRHWTARLGRALREDLFVVHYQPIVSLTNGEVSHYEALVRLGDRPDQRLLAPAEFLPAAERYGLVQEIDRMVLSKVLTVMAGELRDDSGSGRLSLSRPRDPLSNLADGIRRPRELALGLTDGPLVPAPASATERATDGEQRQIRVAVNLSALSVTDATMLGHIEAELSRQEVDPSRMVVEITETSAIGHMPRARAFCEGLQAIGCSVALDDFGVGFGSFQYVKHLAFHYLKIDGDFIRALPSSPRDQLLVRALVGVARGLGKQTIAEYVRDELTVDLLRELGVDYAQGFGVGRPRTAEETFVALAA